MKTIVRLMRPQNTPNGLKGWIDAQMTPRGHEPEYARAAALLDLRPDDELLDVACGVGALLQRHAARVRHVAGLDHSRMQVNFARQRLADRIAAGTGVQRRGVFENLVAEGVGVAGWERGWPGSGDGHGGLRHG